MNFPETTTPVAPERSVYTERDAALPWDIYETHDHDLTVLEGNWDFNSQMRVILNGTTRKNGQPMENPVTLEGIVRATRDVNGKVSYFLKAAEGRSADIYFVKPGKTQETTED